MFAITISEKGGAERGEGFDTPDLRAARELLDELSADVSNCNFKIIEEVGGVQVGDG